MNEGFIVTCSQCQGEGKFSLGRDERRNIPLAAIRCDNCGYMIVTDGDGTWKEIVKPKDVQ